MYLKISQERRERKAIGSYKKVDLNISYPIEADRKLYNLTRRHIGHSNNRFLIVLRGFK